MRSNVPAGTAGTTATEKAPAGTLYAQSTVPGKTVYLRSDAPLARDTRLEYGSELRSAYQPQQGNRDPNVKDISFVIKTSEVWDIVNDPNGYVYPASFHLVCRVASHASVTRDDVKAGIARLLGSINDDVIDSLLRQRTAVQG